MGQHVRGRRQRQVAIRGRRSKKRPRKTRGGGPRRSFSSDARFCPSQECADAIAEEEPPLDADELDELAALLLQVARDGFLPEAGARREFALSARVPCLRHHPPLDAPLE